jgi:aminoglycoside phosphotransferase (APT) family kinase protein
LPADPLGKVFGHFDCHGWNMAFDHANQKLNGIFDFGDSGIGDAHRDFIYPSLLSPQHAFRVADHYETYSGKRIDRKRLALLISYHRLMEMAEYQSTPALFAYADANWKSWSAFASKQGLF